MSISITNRLGLYRWSADSDSILREQIDESHASIEAYGAKILSGNSLPSVGSASYARTFFLNTTTKIVYFYSSEDAFGTWTPINTNIILVTLAENKGDILVASGPDQWVVLPVGTQGQVLSVVDENSTIGWVTLLVTKGDLLTLDGTSISNLTVGSNNHVLIANSSEPNGLEWSQVQTSSISDLGVLSTKFQSSAATAIKFSDGAATSIKILDGSVTETKIQPSSVSTSKISNLAVVGSKINDGSVTETKIADGSITSVKFIQGSAVTSKIADLNVGSFEVAPLAITTDKLGDGSVVAGKIVNLNVLSTHILAGSVTSPKIDSLSVEALKLSDGSVITSKIADLSVTTDKIFNSSVGSIQMSSSSVTEPKINDDAITNRVLSSGSVVSAKVSNSAVINEKIINGAITTIKMAPNSVDSVSIRQSVGLSVIGNSGSIRQTAADIVASEDSVMLQRTSGTPAFSRLTTSSVADKAVTGSKLANLTLVNSDISTTANINLVKLGEGTVPSSITTATANYLDRSVTMEKLNSSQTSDGVGVWFSYTPVVRRYRLPSFPSNDGEYPGDIVDPADYTVLYAKYLKIHEWVSVRCRIVLNASFTTTSGGGLCIGLPFLPALKNNSVIGHSFAINVDTIKNQLFSYAMNENSVQSVTFGATNVYSDDGENPVIRTNLENWPDPQVGFISTSPYVVGQFTEKYDQVSFSVQYPTLE